MSQLIEDFYNQSVGDYFVLITGILYVLLAARNNPICWLFGIASSSVLAYLTVSKYGLYADGVLNAFYVVMGVIGLYKWLSGGKVSSLKIGQLSFKEIAVYFICGTVLAVLSSIFLSQFTGAMATTLDSFTTVFSIIATIWLVRRKIDNWWLWVAVDAVYVYLYLSRGAILYAVLLFIYTIIALWGYIEWKRLMQVEKKRETQI